MRKQTRGYERFLTVLRREVSRFWLIKRQTLLTPLIETYLYISVFGAALGSRIQSLDGFPYIVFIIPGLIMMTMAMNSMGNNMSSVFQQKFGKSIEDQLASPLSNVELVSAYTLGGFIRGGIIATVTLVTASFLVDLPMVHPEVFFGALVLIGLFFALLGVLLGTLAESFDQMSLFQSFLLQPLIFLGGIFYSVDLLPPVAEAATHFNPVFYMINTVRYGMLGRSDTDPWIALGVLCLVVTAMFLVVLQIFRSGYKLRV